MIPNTGSPPLTWFSINMVHFGTLICPFSTKSILRLHSFLLTRLIFQSLSVSRLLDSFVFQSPGFLKDYTCMALFAIFSNVGTARQEINISAFPDYIRN